MTSVIVGFVVITILSLVTTYWIMIDPVTNMWGTPHPVLMFITVFIMYTFLAVGSLSGSGGGGNTTTSRPTNNTATTTSPTSNTDSEPKPVYEPDPEPNNPFSDVIEEDWSPDSIGSDTDPINIDENPGRTRGDYEDIDPNIGSDEPRYSDHRQNREYRGSTAYGEEEDNEDLSDIDVDLDDL